MSQLVDPPLELLVCLAVQRHGEREWAAVHRSVSTVLSALGHAGPPVALEPLYRASREAAGADAVLGTCVGELIARRIAYLTTRVGSLKASLAKAEADEAKGRTGRTRGGATVDSLGQDVEGVDSWVELAEEVRAPHESALHRQAPHQTAHRRPPLLGFRRRIRAGRPFRAPSSSLCSRSPSTSGHTHLRGQ